MDDNEYITHNKYGQRLGYYDFMLENSRKAALLEKAKNGNKMIWVTFKKEGIHKYPAALDDPTLATGDWDDVSFLGYPHRHIFHFRVQIEVFNNDRDIEFIQFKRWLQRLYDMAPHGEEQHDNSTVLELDYKSCEMIAEELYLQINFKYPNRKVTIEVSEDGENGCEITWEK